MIPAAASASSVSSASALSPDLLPLLATVPSIKASSAKLVASIGITILPYSAVEESDEKLLGLPGRAVLHSWEASFAECTVRTSKPGDHLQAWYAEF